MTKAERLKDRQRERDEAFRLWQSSLAQAQQHREALLRIEGAITEIQSLPDEESHAGH